MGYKIDEKKLNANPNLKRYFESLKRSYVWLTCRICGVKEVIHTNNKSLYTQEVRNNYKCLKHKKL